MVNGYIWMARMLLKNILKVKQEIFGLGTVQSLTDC